jgi:APA family basic amino acid/polyamine antiporter
MFNNALVLAKLLVLILFCLLGALYVQRANFTPFDPASLGVLSGASYIFFAYGGFARVAVVAEEVREPERNVPRAILLSLAIFFYYSVANICALRLRSRDRVYPRIVPALGFSTCLGLLVALLLTSPRAWLIGIAGLSVGAFYYAAKGGR